MMQVIKHSYIEKFVNTASVPRQNLSYVSRNATLQQTVQGCFGQANVSPLCYLFLTEHTHKRSCGTRTDRTGHSHPCICSFSSSLSPSIPQVSWSSSSRLCWLAADSLSSAIAKMCLNNRECQSNRPWARGKKQRQNLGKENHLEAKLGISREKKPSVLFLNVWNYVRLWQFHEPKIV